MSELHLTSAQQAAVENRGGSLLVSAAAGSGKTKVLVERLFRYITDEHCNVDDFLIITYTKAAAAELRGKIAAELSKRLARMPGDDHLRRQLLRVYQADIKTVDAFCTALLRENTHLLSREEDSHSLSPDFRILDESEAQLLRERVLSRVLEEFYAHLDEGGEELANTLGFGRDDRTLVALVLELFEKLQSHAWPEKWLAENASRWEAFRTAEGGFDGTEYAFELLNGVARQADYWRKVLMRAVGQMADCPALEKGYADRFSAVAEQLERVCAAAESGSWEAAGESIRGLKFPKLAPVKDADGGEQKARSKKVWDGCKGAVKKLYALLDVSGEEAMADLSAVAPAMLALLRLTADFAESYRKEKLRQNAADFSDQEHLALTILVSGDGTPTELGVQVAARYREILVDEYQDTNEVQNTIFHAVSKDGKNLFTVGDVKQSVYRFRLADPTIFLRKYAAFRPDTEAQEGEERKILLSQNFRSRKEILDAVNFVFENILSTSMGEMEYGEEEALHFGAEYYPERHDCETEFHLISCRQKRGDSDQPVKRLVAETRFVASRIRLLLDQEYPVTESDGSLRPCKPDDFAILMRAPGSRSAAYANALAEQNLPCSFEESGDFFSSIEVSTVLALLEILDNERQDVPLITVLRSPAFGFVPDRLAEIRGKTPEGSFFDAVAHDGREDCRSFLETLEELRLLARDMSVHRLLWHLYNRLNLLGVFGAMENGARRKENLIALTELAESFEKSGYCGVFSFVTQLRQLLASKRAPQVRGNSNSAGVRIMSIHKSKGLEFPIVILTDLDHTFSRLDFNSPVLVHPTLGLGPMRVDLERKIKYPTLARQALEEVLVRENKSEEQRILYVAMTRAKEKLILVDAMYEPESRLQKLLPLASCPAFPESVGACKSFGEWILLPLLCRPEAIPLRQLAGMEVETLFTGDTASWLVFVQNAEDYREVLVRYQEDTEAKPPEVSFDPALLEFIYPYQRVTKLPAKLTATQLKGRELDEEIAQQAAHVPYLRPLSQPRFRQEAVGLTAAEAGTATHLVLQYLNFEDPDVAGQVERLRQRRLLTDEQAAAVPVLSLDRLLHSPLAEELRRAKKILREYRFTLLMDAAEYDPAVAAGDSILLQGIVDCCFESADGTLTVVDFKTDRVSGDRLQDRAEHYRPQLEAYSAALTRVLEQRVTRKILYFLDAGEAVEL